MNKDTWVVKKCQHIGFSISDLSGNIIVNTVDRLGHVGAIPDEKTARILGGAKEMHDILKEFSRRGSHLENIPGWAASVLAQASFILRRIDNDPL